jgi:PIN domain nuclease of toxin-antitoxin system
LIHTLIWFLQDSHKLSAKAKSLIEDLNNEVYVHAISWFEMSIKAKIGKLSLADPIDITFIQATKNGISTIEIKTSQLMAYQSLPFFENHRDPFDRLIIATAVQEGLCILSDDPKFPWYRTAQVLW